MKNLLFFPMLIFLAIGFYSCEEEEVEGCTDDCATNYNADATDDDGSCMYSFLGTYTIDEWKIDGVSLFDQSWYNPLSVGAISFDLSDSGVGIYGMSVIYTDGQSLQDAGTFSNTATQVTFYSNYGGTDVWTTTKMNCLEFDGYLYDDDGLLHEIELDWSSSNARYLDAEPGVEKFDVSILKKGLTN